MKQLMKILKIGTTKGDYPYYCQHINFTEDKIQTCNGSVFVDMEDNKYPIEGAVNFNILESVLNNCETPQIQQEGALLKIKDGSYSSEIIVDTLEFPDSNLLGIDTIEITSELLYLLTSAMKYTGEGLLSYVYMDSTHILATKDKQKAFYYEHSMPMKVGQVIGINSKILSTLSEGVEIGTSKDNTVVKFDGGQIVFKIALLNNYPKEELVNGINNKPLITKLCNVQPIQESVKKVSSLLINETEKVVYLENKENVLTIKATSISQGESTVKLNSELKESFKIKMQVKFLSGIDLDYDVYVDLNKNNTLYLTNQESEILLAGVRE